MTSNIYDLYDPTYSGSDSIATVIEAKDGQAIRLNLNGVSCPVAGHLSGVEALHNGDRVATLRTDEGPIVAGRLRAKDEAPAPRLKTRDGHLVLEADQSVCLQAGKHRIEVHANGRIELDGQQITGQAEGCIRLIGSTIELN